VTLADEKILANWRNL